MIASVPWYTQQELMVSTGRLRQISPSPETKKTGYARLFLFPKMI